MITTMKHSVATHDLSGLAAMLCTIFANDPLFTYAFGADLQAMEAYFYRSLVLCDKRGEIETVPTHEGILAWLPSTDFPPALSEEGLGKEAVAAFHRLKQHDATPEKIIAAATSRFAYIWLLGVAPSGRGKGYARQLMERALEHMERQGFEECWLSTEREENKPFYRKLGFELFKEITAPSGIVTYVYRRLLKS